jgi:hypothetical protein
MKINLIDQAGGFDKESGDLVKREDIDIVTNYLIEKPNGDTLMMQREGLRSFMTSVCNSAETNKYIDSSFMLTQGNTNDGKRLSYIYLYFYHTQVLIANTYLSRFEDNCARCETLVLKNIISQF